MPDRKVRQIAEILHEIAQLTHNERVRQLTRDLGELIAGEIGTTREILLNYRDTSTAAIVDVTMTLEDTIRIVRMALDDLRDGFKQHLDTAKERDDLQDRQLASIAEKLDTLASLVAPSMPPAIDPTDQQAVDDQTIVTAAEDQQDTSKRKRRKQ